MATNAAETKQPVDNCSFAFDICMVSHVYADVQTRTSMQSSLLLLKVCFRVSPQDNSDLPDSSSLDIDTSWPEPNRTDRASFVLLLEMSPFLNIGSCPRKIGPTPCPLPHLPPSPSVPCHPLLSLAIPLCPLPPPLATQPPSHPLPPNPPFTPLATQSPLPPPCHPSPPKKIRPTMLNGSVHVELVLLRYLRTKISFF